MATNQTQIPPLTSTAPFSPAWVERLAEAMGNSWLESNLAVKAVIDDPKLLDRATDEQVSEAIDTGELPDSLIQTSKQDPTEESQYELWLLLLLLQRPNVTEAKINYVINVVLEAIELRRVGLVEAVATSDLFKITLTEPKKTQLTKLLGQVFDKAVEGVMGGMPAQDPATFIERSQDRKRILKAVAQHLDELEQRYVERIVTPRLVRKTEGLIKVGVDPKSVEGVKTVQQTITSVLEKAKNDKVYWDLVAHQHTNRVHNYGVASAGYYTGARAATYVAVLDERTTTLCRNLNGTVWPIGSVLDVLERDLMATPDELKERDTWRIVNTTDWSKASRADFLSAGVISPPQHPYCRSRLELVY